ncbi:P-loop containing nucleoside triphosphate hydrolase protein, partial [Mycena pura]
WQAHAVQRLLRGFDTMVVAATGLGKSLIFEGTAALAGPRKLVIVVCPLKALEVDQVQQACAKGLDALAINEDTDKTTSTWEHIRTSANLVYMSPEMSRSASFTQKLWKDAKFHKRVAAFIVDEAHCIDEWGEDDFCPAYRLLGDVRRFLGLDVPFCAVTATCRTSTFNAIWKMLYFGNRPFWGIDVGADRCNLFFHTRILKNSKNPVLDALNILHVKLETTTAPGDVPKCLFYLESPAACRAAVDILRQVLPAHLRNCVYAFTGMNTAKSKAKCWEGLANGSIRIVCATDAAGMGCSILDVEFTVVFGTPSSLSVLLQRWGRAGRARNSVGVCLLFV